MIVRGLNSKHSVALYEFMKDYQNLGKYHCEVEEFRKLMGIKAEQYSIFSMLKKRVLDTAVEEINEKTDILISYELERIGRKISAIILKVSPKKEALSSADASQTIREKLKVFGLQDSKVEELLHKHDEQYLWANIAIVEQEVNKGKVSNVIGYLLKAFSDDYRSKETELSKQEEKKRKRLAEEQSRVEESKRLEKQVRSDFEIWKKELIDERLLGLDANEIERHKSGFLESIKDNPIFSKIYEDKGFESQPIQTHRYKKLGVILLSEEERDFEKFKEYQGKT